MSQRILIKAIEGDSSHLSGAFLLAWNLARHQQRGLGVLVETTLAHALFDALPPAIGTELRQHGKYDLDGVIVVDLARCDYCARFDGVALFVGDDATSCPLAEYLPLSAAVILMPGSSDAHHALTARWPTTIHAELRSECAVPELSQPQREGAEWFETRYDLRVSGHINPAGHVHELGKGEPQICRYCGGTEPKVTFSNVSHALPEQIGNKKLIDLRECDSCNAHFSTLEDSFGKWSLPVRNMGRVKGKKNKIPKYRSADQQMRVEYSNGRMNVFARLEDPRVGLDPQGKQLRISMERQPYVPVAVYKSFVKMALAVMPHDVANRFAAYTRWILEPAHSDGPFRPLLLLSQFAPGPAPSDQVTYLLLERKAGTDTCPSVLFVLKFSNYVHQIVLPLPPDQRSQGPVKLDIRYFPNPWDTPERVSAFGQVNRWQTDLSSTQVREGDSMPISLAFDSISKTKLDLGEESPGGEA